MNWDQLQGKWKQVKGSVKRRRTARHGLDVLRAMSRNINAELAHDGYRLGSHEIRLRTRAFHVEPLAAIMPQQPFGHLASR